MIKMLKDVKILLADDDEEVLAALNDVLRSEGYEVIMAKNGREAIEHFHEGHIDIALLDLNMPIKGGWETFERLTTIHPLLPIIVITARPEQYPLAVAAGRAEMTTPPVSSMAAATAGEVFSSVMSPATAPRSHTRYGAT